MKDVPVLVAGPLSPSNFNAGAQELRNLVLSSGQTLTTADLYQVAKAIADLVSAGDFYTGGGIADAYTAAVVSPRQGVHALQNGAVFRFVVPATNTGASTLNVNSLGVKDLKDCDGNALAAGALIINETVTVMYNSGADEFRLINRSSILNFVPQVGMIIPFNDFNGLVTYDSTYFAWMNDQVLSDANSPLNSQTLRDMSNRYLVGLGSEGGGDIGSVAWSDTPVGNAGHTVDLAHTHGPGTLQFQVADRVKNYGGGYDALFMYDSGGGSTTIMQTVNRSLSSTGNYVSFMGDTATASFYTKSGAGVSASSLSSTQSIQTRSVPVRFVVRKR